MFFPCVGFLPQSKYSLCELEMIRKCECEGKCVCLDVLAMS